MDRANGGVPDDDLDSERPDVEAYAAGETDDTDDHFRPSPFEPDDAYDYEQYGALEGQVEFISPDSEVLEGQGAAFYLVKIAVAANEIGRGAFRGRVRIGMTGQAEIVTGRESLLTLLSKKIRQTISLN